MPWDGTERRKMDSDQRDLIIEMHTDMKHMVKWTEAHDLKDDTRFDKIDKSNKWRDKLLYGALGIIAFIEFVTRFIK